MNQRLLLALALLLQHLAAAWVGGRNAAKTHAPWRRSLQPLIVSPLSAQDKDENDNDDNDDTSSLGWDVSKNDNDNDILSSNKLGIDIGSLLAPLSQTEAAELKAAATEVINDAVAAGIDEIADVRAQMKQELEQQRQAMQLQSEGRAREASVALMSKIDALADAFLANTTLSRTSTKLAALADQAMEGRGVDMGTWGTLGGATVVTGTTGLGGSRTQEGVSASTASSSSSAVATQATTTSRLLVVADTRDDPFAKQLLAPLTQELEQVVPDLEVQSIQPTETWPLGANNAAAVVLFLTSLSDASTVKNGLERLLRQTLAAGGSIAQPPTQIVAISSVGTARTNQMPYSMQNLMGGGKLDKRKQMEEAVQLTVEQAPNKLKPPYLDYTLCKLGDLKASGIKQDFDMRPSDVLDGTLEVDSAVAVLKQAIALQPAARNATFCATGGSVASVTQDEWDDLFLRLDGPELLRLNDLAVGDFGSLVEYFQEWSQLAETSKGLTTPIRVEQATPVRPRGVRQQHAIQLLYLPTATGARYMSRDEEKQRERERSSGGASSPTPPPRRPTQEGGLEILVEVMETPKAGMRVRVRRCNYAPGVIIKELTEETLLSRIKKTVDVWRNDHDAS